jgi:HSP20 family molecular chaperone IbpA
MDYLFQLVLEPTANPLLPAGETPVPLSLFPHTLDAEITELDKEVMVTINRIPRIENAVFSCSLMNERTLKISCDLRYEKTMEQEGCCMQEKHFCSLHREIPLPAKVTKTGATSTLKNGVLDIHLRKGTKKHSA